MANTKNTFNIFKSLSFATAFAFSFFFMVVGASTVGFVPYYIDGTESPRMASAKAGYSVGSIQDSVFLNDLPMLGDEVITPDSTPVSQPVRIVAKSIDLDLPVANPNTTNVDALDKVLSSAVARYPGSAEAGQSGNVLIFGHSSHLPVVINHFYQAFNNLPDLKEGSIVSLIGENGLSYNYSVTEIRRTDATEEYIDLSSDGGKILTLSTCDTFGKKSARWVVEAKFIGTSQI